MLGRKGGSSEAQQLVNGLGVNGDTAKDDEGGESDGSPHPGGVELQLLIFAL